MTLQKVDDYLDGMFCCRFWVNAYGIIEAIKGLAPSSLILRRGNGDNPENQRRAKMHDEFFVSLFHLKASFWIIRVKCEKRISSFVADPEKG